MSEYPNSGDQGIIPDRGGSVPMAIGGEILTTHLETAFKRGKLDDVMLYWSLYVYDVVLSRASDGLPEFWRQPNVMANGIVQGVLYYIGLTKLSETERSWVEDFTPRVAEVSKQVLDTKYKTMGIVVMGHARALKLFSRK
jgi:hypothetical protein